jgi:glycosyltransferase involved in cell wall biosynthesis
MCYIDTIGSHYREPIFRLIEKEFECHFFFGDLKSSVPTIDYVLFPGFKRKLHVIPILGNIYYLVGALKASKEYRKIILTGDPHGIHVWLILIYARLTGRETYTWTHGWYGRETLIKRLIKKLFYKLPTKILTYGNYARKLMITEGIPSEKLVTIYNSLDLDKHRKLREKFCDNLIYHNYFGNNSPVLFYIGRVQKVKRIDFLIELVFELRRMGEVVNLCIVGKEVDHVGIEALVSFYDLKDQVWIYGPSYNEEHNCELITCADICISPGNVGLTAIHAMTYGCPVITHGNFPYQCPEFEAIKPGITGDFFEQDNLKDLMRVVLNWLPKIRTNRYAIRNFCQQEIDLHWSPHVQIEILKKIFQS